MGGCDMAAPALAGRPRNPSVVPVEDERRRRTRYHSRDPFVR
jgi:hypothetical protein